jgi:hypothetical protein
LTISIQYSKKLFKKKNEKDWFILWMVIEKKLEKFSKTDSIGKGGSLGNAEN